MSDKISVLAVDDNEEFMAFVENILTNNGAFNFLGCAYNGDEAVNKILSLQPDLVLLDVVMPYKDGIAVLEELKQLDLQKRPIVIMITAIGEDRFIKKALELGAEYYILKPFDLTFLPNRIIGIYKEAKKETYNTKKIDVSFEEIETEVIRALRDIGVSPHLNGYLYLKKAIAEVVLSEKGYIPVTTELYPRVAALFNTESTKVERSIRGAIQKAWSRCNLDRISYYFPATEAFKSIKPTNSEFIATIADKIRLKNIK